MAEEKKVTEKDVITAVYKVNLHCQQCARDIKKPLLSTQGVHSVEADSEKSEVKVKGVIDVIKIHKLLEKLSKKKVELVSPLVKVTESVTEKKEVKVEAKPAPKLSTHSVKVHLHCDKCEEDLRNKLLKHRSIYSVRTDMKAQTITVDGTMEGDKLVAYMRKKVHKNAEIILPKSEKMEEKKENPKVEAKPKEEKAEMVEFKAEKKEVKAEMVEFKAEKKVEVKTTERVAPYVVNYVYAPQFFSGENPHDYVYAPQLFSDENPHACFIM